jgi:hypothetical protein
MKHIKTTVASLGLLLASASGSTFAAQDCDSLIPNLNKEIATYLATVGPREIKTVAMDKFANMVDPRWGHPVVTVDSFTLPVAISKKLVYRFTDAATKGVRTANSRLICSFRFEANDGFESGKGIANFDVEPFSNTNQVTMFVSPGEARSGVKFRASGQAQELINDAVRRTIARDPKYKPNFEVAF